MSVVRREALRRWGLVGAAAAVVCLVPVAIAAWPQPSTQIKPEKLRDLIVASADQPYQGYIDVNGDMGLPDLPYVTEFAGLLSGSTRLRAWYASPQAWRVAELTGSGETDTYRTTDSTYVWYFASNQVIRTIGDAIRLPRAADLVPPNLARRLLQGATGTDQLAALPARRVAGAVAAGVRWTPSDPDTTVGSVDVWADPQTGLAVSIAVNDRKGRAVFGARFLELEQKPPSADLLVPARPKSAGYGVTTAEDAASMINGVATVGLPSMLADRQRWATSPGAPEINGLGAYGQGVSVLAVVALPGRVGAQTVEKIHDGGGVPVELPGAEAYEIHTSLVNVLVVRAAGSGRGRRTYLLAGSVTPELLRQAGAQLLQPQARP